MNANEKQITGLATILPDREKYEAQRAYFVPPKKRKYDVNFMVIWKESSNFGVSIPELVANPNIVFADIKVLLHLMCICEFGNRVFVSPVEVAAKTNTHRATVYRAIKHLCDLGVLTADGTPGQIGMYTINAATCYHGSLDRGIPERKQEIQAHGVSVRKKRTPKDRVVHSQNRA